jgi:integrase/recombinase XerD
LPKLEKRLPKHTLSHQEAETILNQPDVSDSFGMRYRAILEVLYSPGLRRMEIANLKWRDFGSDRGTLMVRQGKRKKDRKLKEIHTATHPARLRNTVLDELKGEIDDDDS